MIKKKKNGDLENIFIKDSNGSINTIVNEVNKSSNSTIIAKKGFTTNNKLVLFNGYIQTLNEKKEIKNVNFEKTELSLNNFSTRTIKQPKLQETSTYNLMKCYKSKKDEGLQNCSYKNKKKEVVETLSRRMGMPLYIPLISIIASFMLIYKKEKKYNYLKKYIIFTFAFIILLFAEIVLKFTGFSNINFVLYFVAPLFLFITLYALLIKNMTLEKRI